MKREQLDVIPPGSDVLLWPWTEAIIPAIVQQVCIQQNNHVQYQVVWWDGNSRQCEWVEASEVKAATDQKQPIGFIQG